MLEVWGRYIRPIYTENSGNILAKNKLRSCTEDASGSPPVVAPGDRGRMRGTEGRSVQRPGIRN